MILDLIALDKTSKVWIYQADRELTYDELDDARADVFDFLRQWTAHSSELDCYGNIFHRRFLALFVDESKVSASGCSIDGSVRFVTSLGKRLGVDFFDRMTYVYMTEDEEILTLPHSQVKQAYKERLIKDETLFFDNLVQTKEDFLKSWLKPLKESWHSRFI